MRVFITLGTGIPYSRVKKCHTLRLFRFLGKKCHACHPSLPCSFLRMTRPDTLPFGLADSSDDDRAEDKTSFAWHYSSCNGYSGGTEVTTKHSTCPSTTTSRLTKNKPKGAQSDIMILPPERMHRIARDTIHFFDQSQHTPRPRRKSAGWYVFDHTVPYRVLV